MHASASALTREGEVQSKIRKVRAFGRGARIVCSALLGFGLVGSLFMLFLSVLGLVLPGPISNITNAGLTPEQRMWVLPMWSATMAAWLAIMYQFYRLFGSLAAGEIYTSENVRRIRRVGVLYLLLAVLGVLLPIAWATLVTLGIVEPSDSSNLPVSIPWQESLGSFLTAGFILLVSWVMDVGLYEKDHADALQRDADLVI